MEREGEDIYILKDMKDILQKHEKEALGFYAEIRANLLQIQKELRELQMKRAEDSKEIEYIKNNISKHETRLNMVYVVLVVCGFLILLLFAK